MKVLLTGASGFLGRAIARRLVADGHESVLPQRGGVPRTSNAARVKPLEVMALEDWLPLLQGVEGVIHAAAIAHIGPDVPAERYRAVNCDAAETLAKAAAAAGVARFVFISSIRAQVGASSPDVQTEDSPPQPTEPYGASKLLAEQRISAVFPAATHFRPPLIVGDEPKGNLAVLLRLARTPLPLPVAGLIAPQAMVSRENFVDAIMLALHGGACAGETFVIADDPHPGLADMLRWLREGLAMSPRQFAVPEALLRLPATALGRSAMFARLTAGLTVDASKIRAAGWRQRVSPAETFRALAAASRG